MKKNWLFLSMTVNIACGFKTRSSNWTFLKSRLALKQQQHALIRSKSLRIIKQRNKLLKIDPTSRPTCWLKSTSLKEEPTDEMNEKKVRLERSEWWNNRQVVAEPPIQLMRKFSNPGQEAILKPKVQRRVKRRRVHLFHMNLKIFLKVVKKIHFWMK